MTERGIYLNGSHRNDDLPEMIDEYSDIFGLSKANTVFTILREYPKLKQAERVRKLQAISKTGIILNAI